MYAIVPSFATDGEASGPAPVVSCTGAPPDNGSHQMLVAPPRFDAWTRPSPSLVKFGQSENTVAGSRIAGRGGPPSVGTSHISPAIPPVPLTIAMVRPSGDHAGLRGNGYLLSAWRTMRASDPSMLDTVSCTLLPSALWMYASRRPSGAQAASAALGIVATGAPPSVGKTRTPGTPLTASRTVHERWSPSGEKRGDPSRDRSSVKRIRAPPEMRPE